MTLVMPEDEYRLVRRIWALLEAAGAAPGSTLTHLQPQPGYRGNMSRITVLEACDPDSQS